MTQIILATCAFLVILVAVKAWLDGRKALALLGIPLLFLIGLQINQHS